MITLVGDEWCPFNCLAVPNTQGTLVDSAKSALAQDGYQINYLQIPWSRAIIGVRDGVYDAIVGVGLRETPDFHFPSQPLAFAHHSFFTLPSQTWTFRGLKSLDEVRIGVIQDYSYGSLYEDYIRAHEADPARVAVLKGNKVLPRLVKMLQLGRIDALVAEEQVLNYHFQSRGLENPLRHAGLAAKEALYVAFSPALADSAELAEILGRRLKAMHRLSFTGGSGPEGDF
ncbi:MAG: transporter substrate-binding domain-containing protein [Marinobacter sp.]|uniref:substrate-binding periplasmic protein n=1 Tax=Marinobacter sp. TaxID=50741 RepID=UPI00299CE430|nr:transporter substrate-binding domain-containing protein [Marinobacter sp.]MDX1634121.1 transporter substrate-binding domain-containing protein [Marinobacter sp.]